MPLQPPLLGGNPDEFVDHIAPDVNIVHEASMFGEEVVVADLDPSRATAANARNSMGRGPLSDSWKEGVMRVRVIEEGTRAPTKGRLPARN